MDTFLGFGPIQSHSSVISPLFGRRVILPINGPFELNISGAAYGIPAYCAAFVRNCVPIKNCGAGGSSPVIASSVVFTT